MVKFWDEQLTIAIKKTKRRIKLAEKHGIGEMAMREKSILKLQEKHKLEGIQ